MAVHQLGRELSADEVSAVVSWLGSLTGTVRDEYMTPPELPGDATPPGSPPVP
jgi:hypothetical protein